MVFVSCVLAGALRAALLSCRARWGPWCAKLASNVLCRAVRLGQQKGRLIRAAHRGSVCPVVGHLNATKGCAISPIIARRMGADAAAKGEIHRGHHGTRSPVTRSAFAMPWAIQRDAILGELLAKVCQGTAQT